MYEQYTDKQIVEMLIPKLKATELDWNWEILIKYPEPNKNILKAIATIYRSAYIRGQLGRSFIIGEQKERDFATAFQVEDKVKLITKNDIDESNPCFPPIGTIGKVVELSPEFCFVQWPKGAVYSNGALSCPYSFLEKVTDEKVTEHWVPATKDNVKIGSKVRMINGKLHNENPRWFPVVGTVGIVRNFCDINCDVQWPKGTTSWQDKWWCNYEHLEVLLCEE